MKHLIPRLACGLCLILSASAAPLLDRPVGLQLYTFRDELAKDLPGTLDRVRDLGFKEVETTDLYGRPAAEFRRLLDERGLTCVSMTTRYANVTKEPDEVAAKAKALGAQFVVVSWLPGRQPFTLAHATQTAEEFNRIGKYFREKHELKFCYHVHGYEFAAYAKGTLFDVVVDQTRAEDVCFELDTLWAKHAGVDQAALLRQHGERFKLVHLKDLKAGVPVGDLSGNTDRDNDVALGTGQIDLPSVIEAGRLVGVKYFFLEDESRRLATQIPQSLRFLKGETPAKDGK